MRQLPEKDRYMRNKKKNALQQLALLCETFLRRHAALCPKTKAQQIGNRE